MATMNKPSTMVLAATQHDSLLHLIDCRLGNIVTDLKVCLGSAGLIRCLSSDPDGYTVTIGHSSGFISQLDIRTGKLRQAWKVLTITTQYPCLLRFIFLEILSLKLSVVVFYSI
jgi:WD repeat-containing protein 81